MVHRQLKAALEATQVEPAIGAPEPAEAKLAALLLSLGQAATTALLDDIPAP